MGIMPSSQLGSVAGVSFESSDVSLNNPYFQFHQGVASGSYVFTMASASGKSQRLSTYKSGSSSADDKVPIDSITGSLSMQNSFNVLALRQAEALQKWSEVSLSGNNDYKAQIEKHFGVSVPAGLANLCQFIGGVTSNLNFGEVVNTNLVDNQAGQAYIQGKGFSSGQGFIDFEAKEHGILMCIYHCMPLLDYDMSGSCSMLNLKTQATDYAIPEFDKIGMQELPALALFGVLNDPTIISHSVGYVPRYVDYKTSIDRIHGDFTSNLGYWVTPLDVNSVLLAYYSSSKNSVTYPFFKVDPRILDSIFASSAVRKDDNGNNIWSDDQFMINSFFDVKAVRNLDYNGFPY